MMRAILIFGIEIFAGFVRSDRPSYMVQNKGAPPEG